MRLWSAWLGFRVLSGEATARIAMGIFSPASAFTSSGDWRRCELISGRGRVGPFSPGTCHGGH